MYDVLTRELSMPYNDRVAGECLPPMADAGVRREHEGMERLRGRNLSHIGCTLGLTLGLLLGLTLAIVVLQVATAPESAAMGVFAAVTLGLGGLGFYLGGVATRRLWGDKQRPQ
jgi:hypothetical protein